MQSNVVMQQCSKLAMYTTCSRWAQCQSADRCSTDDTLLPTYPLMHGTHRHYHHSHRRRYSCEHFVNRNDGQPLSFCSCFTGPSLLLLYEDLIWHSNAWKNSLTRPIQFPLRDNQLFWTITAFLKDPFHPLPIWQVERKLNILKVTMHYLLLPHISTTSPSALSPLPSHSPLFTPAPHLPNSLTCISVNSCSPWPSCVRHGCACVRCA